MRYFKELIMDGLRIPPFFKKSAVGSTKLRIDKG